MRTPWGSQSLFGAGLAIMLLLVLSADSRAAFEDLAKTPGVNAATARAVYDFFHAGA